MKKTFLIVILSVLFFIAGCANEPAVNEDNLLEATVVNVVDGDTIDVKFSNGEIERVRLVLVDTPETKHPRLGKQPFGEEASAFTEKHLNQKKVRLEFDVSERDRYGRLLAYVWIDGQNFNRLLLEEGLARVAIFPPDIKYLDQFEEVQKQARHERKGIWSIEDYVHDKGFSHSSDQSEQTGEEAPKQIEKDCNIKGNINSKKEKIYHLPTGQYYDRVIPEAWFCTEEEAKEAGFRPSMR